MASETAISAGWAFSVKVSWSAGPSQITVGELLAQRIIDLGEQIAGGGKIVRERLAHADGLAALALEKRRQLTSLTPQNARA